MKLVLAEEMAVGQISLKTYKAYVNAAGGWFLVILVLLLCCLASATQAFADFWLSIWIDSLPQVNYVICFSFLVVCLNPGNSMAAIKQTVSINYYIYCVK